MSGTTVAKYDEFGYFESQSTSQYQYDDSGVRISQTVGDDKTLYVIDKNNHTGYSQVMEEGVDADADGVLAAGEVAKSYVIGHDVIAQAANVAADAVLQYLVYDGHGSTRAILDAARQVITAGGVQQLFAYDAYGNLVAGPGLVARVTDAITSLLYSGEQTDQTGLQYLRARYYNAVNGRFNRLDPFAGAFDDPQSLHKYLYTHGDPINGIDPTGEFAWFLWGLVYAPLIGGAFAAAIFWSWGIALGPQAGDLDAQRPSSLAEVSVLYHSAIIRGGSWSLDQAFDEVTSFRHLPSSQITAYNSPQSQGDIVTFGITSEPERLGQRDFRVRVTKLDSRSRLMVAETLTGHPVVSCLSRNWNFPWRRLA